MFKAVSKTSWKFFFAGKGMGFRTGRYFLESAFLGALVGLVTVGFRWLIGVGAELLARWNAAPSGAADTALYVALPALGAAAGALLIGRFGHVRHARGTDSAVRAFHQDEDIPRTVIPVKSVASVLTVASGGSAGYEGPVTLLGAACGRVVTRLMGLDRHAARILLAAGVGAAIAALFRAPLAGAIFGAEIFYSSSDLEYEAILPSFIASAVSYTVFACVWGWDPLFTMAAVKYSHGLHLLPYFFLAVVITFGARFYIAFFRGTENWFARRGWPVWTKVVLGGVFVGALSLLFPSVRGTGYPAIQRCLAEPGQVLQVLHVSENFLPLALLAFFFAKVFATSLTVGSGGSGGVFAPAIVCGGALGAATGFFARNVLPASVGIAPAEFALVGMAGFLASSVRVPLAAIVMVAEISGNHGLLLPAMWVCGISFWLNNGWSLYRSQVHDRDSSPVHA